MGKKVLRELLVVHPYIAIHSVIFTLVSIYAHAICANSGTPRVHVI